jgi:outer membrane protein assembly factor BamB
VAFGRVYLGNTDGNVYAFTARSGQLAWRRGTGSYVYGSPAAARTANSPPSVYVGSADGNFYALDARDGSTRFTYRTGGRQPGGPVVIGEVVYFSDTIKRLTIGVSTRTGKRVFRFKDGSFNPVITDGERLYLTGYTRQYALVPRKGKGAQKQKQKAKGQSKRNR